MDLNSLAMVDFLKSFDEGLDSSALVHKPDAEPNVNPPSRSKTTPATNKPPVPFVTINESYSVSAYVPQVEDSALRVSILDLSDLPDSPCFRTKMAHTAPSKPVEEPFIEKTYSRISEDVPSVSLSG
jgi:hypothetical protein